MLGLLAVAPCGRELSVDAWIRRRRGLPALDPSAPGLAAVAAPVRVRRGLRGVGPEQARRSRLVRRHGHLAARRARLVTELEAWPLPGLGGVAPDRPRASTRGRPRSSCSPSCSSRSGCGRRRTRYAAVWVAVVFHVTIEVSASVQVFSFLAIAVLVVWAVPSTRDRVLRIDPTARRHRRWSALVRRLDWLARFRVEPAPPGSRLEVVDRDGATFHGAPAVALLLSRLPLSARFRTAGAAPSARPPGAGAMSVTSRALRAVATLALLLALCVHRGGAAGALPDGHDGGAPAVGRRPPSTGSSATSGPDGTWLYLYDADRDETPVEYNPVRHAGVTMGLYQAAAADLPGALDSADRGTEWALDRLHRARRLGRARRGRARRDGRDRPPGRRPGDPPGGDRRTPLRRRPGAGSGASCVAQTEPSGAVLANYDATRERAGPRRVLQVLHRRGLLGPGAAASRVPGRGLGRSTRTGSAPTWRPRATRPRITGRRFPITGPRTASPRRSSSRARSPPLTEDEVSYARRPGRALRHPGAVGQPALRAVGRAGAGQLRAARRRLRRHQRGADRMVAGRAGGPAAGRPATSRSPSARRASPGWRSRRSPTPRTRRAPPGPSGSRAPGSSTARPGWTTSSTRWPGCCGRSRSSRRAPRPGRRRAVGLAVGRSRSCWRSTPPARRSACRAPGGAPSDVARLRRRRAIGGLVVCAVAALARPLLDALDVSEPSFRIAAGIVAVLAGAADVFRRPPRPSPRSPAARAALVPVAFPSSSGPRWWCWRSARAPTAASRDRRRHGDRRRAR